MFKSNFFLSKKKKQSHAQSFTNEGKEYIKSKDYQSAIQSFTKVLTYISNNSIYFLNRAKAYHLLREYDLCLQDCDQALAVEATAAAYCMKARVFYDKNQIDDALICSGKALELSPHDTEIKLLHSKYGEIKRQQQAEEYKNKGDEILNSKQNVVNAIEAYTKAISYVSDNYSYYNRRALAYLLSGQFEFAIYDCDKSLAILPNGKAYGRKAAALCEMDNTDDAMTYIGKGLELLPDNEELKKTESKILEKVAEAHSFRTNPADDFATAAMTCTLALKLSKRGYPHYNNRALAHLGAREYDKAIDDCNASLKIKNNMKAHRNLALIYCEQLNLIDAFVSINTALEMKPDDGQSLDIKRKLERIQCGIEEEKAIEREAQIKDENTLYDAQVNSRVARIMRLHIRLEKQAALVRKNYSRLYGRQMVKKGLRKYISEYAALRAHYIGEENNLLRNQRRARSKRFLTREENELVERQAYSRKRRQKPPPNTIMSSFFKFELEEGKSASDVEILDGRVKIKPLDADDSVATPPYQKFIKISEKIFKKLKKDWKDFPFAVEYTSDEELVISFDSDNFRKDSQPQDQELCRYMTNFAFSGAAAKAKLRPRHDRWGVLEIVTVKPKLPPPSRGYRSGKNSPFGSPNGRTAPFGSPTNWLRTLMSSPSFKSERKSLNSAPDISSSSHNAPLASPLSNTKKVGFTTDSHESKDQRDGNAQSQKFSSTMPDSRRLTMKKAKSLSSFTRDNAVNLNPDKSPVDTPEKGQMQDLFLHSYSFNDIVNAVTSEKKTKEVIIFAFYVPYYDKNSTRLHGDGSVEEEISLIKAYEKRNRAIELKANKQLQQQRRKKIRIGNSRMCMKKSHGTVLPPIDVYGTYEHEKCRQTSKHKSSPSRTLTNILGKIPPPQRLPRSEMNFYNNQDPGINVYNPVALPKDYKLYEPVRNVNSW